jgi:DNA-binding MarR family transcriptional regulator
MEKNLDFQQIKDLGITFSTNVVFMHAAIAGAAGLSGTDHKYLGLIMKKGKMTAGELAKSTGLTTGSVTGLIDRLEKKELVKRQYDDKDRRKVFIVPNEKKSHELLSPLFADLEKQTNKLISSFTKPELKAIEKYFLLATKMIKEVVANISSNKRKVTKKSRQYYGK